MTYKKDVISEKYMRRPLFGGYVGDLLFFIKQSAMAVTLEIRVGYLRAEFFAHTLVLGAFAYPARTITAFGDKSFPNSFYNLFVLVKSYSHKRNFLITSPTAPSSLSRTVT